MKQVIQSYRTGKLALAEVPPPTLRPGGLLVQNVASVVSIGTERLIMDMAKKSLLGKAMARPDLVKQVINKARVDGVREAYRAAMGRLDSPVPLGYSCAGKVLSVGQGVDGLQAGDAVACFGQDYASHSEVVWVPRNLVVRAPEGVEYEAAAFAGVGAIALHAVHTAEARLGDRVAVIGLGLLGLLAVQMLKASGCSVFGIDLDPRKVALAQEMGADEAATPGDGTQARVVNKFSKGWGADSVLVFASSEGNEAVELAAQVVRERGRLVVPGMVGLDLDRRLFYDKQIRFEVSRSAGPGIYDPAYEQKGHDYPLPYIRWTAQRNMEQFLGMVASGQVYLGPIITHRYDFQDAERAYRLITEGSENQIGVVLKYDEANSLPTRVLLKHADRVRQTDQGDGTAREDRKPVERVGVGMIGAGLFANSTLLPTLKGIPGLDLRGIASAGGATARHAADKYGFDYCTSDYREILDDPQVDCVLIATRHNLHAPMAGEALERGKDVFLEKPLATDPEQLQAIIQSYNSVAPSQGQDDGHASGPRLMVGFNRRFSPFSIRAKELLDGRGGPLVAHIRVNAGSVPGDSWVNDPVEGAGRIVGEVCHFVDLAQYLTGSQLVRAYAETIRGNNGGSHQEENLAITLSFQDGSLASIVYAAVGDRAFPRERVELFWDESVCLIDNFKSMTFTRRGKGSRMKKWNVDRGHHGEMKTFFDALQEGSPMAVPFRDYVYTTLATFCIQESIKLGKPVEVVPSQRGLDL
jgi:predicted dehydrogenase/threonine dehydrogenase-like Zn-dependent dehydrogenase